MVLAAVEMLHAVEKRAPADRPVQWKVRIGVHTGPVIAGVVGINKWLSTSEATR
jgi:class 3 adenylate cyclase